MEKYILNNDVTVFCVTAKSFPDGIMEAFQAFEKIDPAMGERPFYGISYKNEYGEIIYKAAVLEMRKGEGKGYGLENFTIKKGEYLTETLFDFMKNPRIIGDTFEKLLASPGVDYNFPCVEWYKSGNEVRCMVRLIQS